MAFLLRQAREEARLTQAELAKRLGEDQSFVSKVERRERRLDLEELRRYCEGAGIDLATFVARWNKPASIRSSQQKSSIQATRAADRNWEEGDWKALLRHLIEAGIVTHKEVASLVLGHLNPSQVGTSIATKKTFRARYPKRKCWEAVRSWHYHQTGKCVDCGTRLELQADHVVPRERIGGKADKLENMTLRCRRCNVVRRPSHKQGGLTFLTAESALMWILFTKRPKTYEHFERLCREYGLTMANIRFQEAWAMARWLAKEGLYEVDRSSKY